MPSYPGGKNLPGTCMFISSPSKSALYGAVTASSRPNVLRGELLILISRVVSATSPECKGLTSERSHLPSHPIPHVDVTCGDARKDTCPMVHHGHLVKARLSVHDDRVPVYNVSQDLVTHDESTLFPPLLFKLLIVQLEVVLPKLPALSFPLRVASVCNKEVNLFRYRGTCVPGR